MPSDKCMHLAGNMQDRKQSSLAGLLQNITILGRQNIGKNEATPITREYKIAYNCLTGTHEDMDY